MVSKCLNSQCSAAFKYLGRGRLFRVNFTEAGRRSAMAGEKAVVSVFSKTNPVEHFWLCEKCATTMTIQFSDAGEVLLRSLDSSVQGPTAASVHNVEAARAKTAS